MRKFRRMLTAAVLTLAASARAGEPPARAVVHLSPRGACECLVQKRCWKLVREAFQSNARIAKTEVEAAMNERFFPGAVAFALSEPDAEGHFLKVQCGGMPCDDKRDDLERRLIVTSFLVSLPLGTPRAELFDETTWAPTSKGEKVFTQAKICKREILRTLIDIVGTLQSN